MIKQAIEHLPHYSNRKDPLEQGRQLVDNANQIYTDGITFSEIYINTVAKQFVLATSSNAVDVILGIDSPRVLRRIDLVIVNTGSQPLFELERTRVSSYEGPNGVGYQIIFVARLRLHEADQSRHKQHVDDRVELFHC